jgi:chromosomal replication initiation ATPase DnaA
MKSPDESLRFEILRSQLDCRALSVLDSTSLKKTLEFITQTVSYSARDFHSALNHLVAHNQLTSHPVTIEIAAPSAI